MVKLSRRLVLQKIQTSRIPFLWSVDCRISKPMKSLPIFSSSSLPSIPHIYLHSSLRTPLQSVRLTGWRDAHATGSALHTTMYPVWREPHDQIGIHHAILDLAMHRPKNDACISCFHKHCTHKLRDDNLSSHLKSLSSHLLSPRACRDNRPRSPPAYVGVRAPAYIVTTYAHVSTHVRSAATDICALGIPYTDMSVVLRAQKKLTKSKNCR
jgi:hypothetical protein